MKIMDFAYMRSIILSLKYATCLLVLSLGTASADDALTIGRCLDVAAGLNALDHYDDAATGKPKQYKLGALRGPIGLNMAVLRAVTESVDKARLGLIAEIGGGKPPQSLEPSELLKLNDEYRKVLEQPCNVKPTHIKISDLHLGDGLEENAIPPSVITALAPILDQ